MEEPASPQRKSAYVRFSSLLLALFLFLAGVFVGRFALTATNGNQTNPVQYAALQDGERQLVFPVFWEAWDVLHDSFIGELDDKQLFYGAVRGLVNAANDPYTVFEDPQDTKQFAETLDGNITGVGIEIGIRDQLIVVQSVLANTPAEAAGLLSGDIIAAVDNQPITQDQTLDDVVQQIRGEKGTDVVLTIVRREDQSTQEISIKRDTIQIESVKLEVRDDIGIITITNFNGDTSKRFTNIARQALQQGVTRLVIDVRNNPGGFLDSAVEISSRFIPKNELIVSERGTKSEEYRAEGTTILDGLPVVVIINQGSASASEILAGALRDHLNAPIIGTTSFGKGSVQEFKKLSDGSSLRVTIAKWYTPSGHNIDGNGITPDIEVEQDRETDEDEQLERAIEEAKQL